MRTIGTKPAMGDASRLAHAAQAVLCSTSHSDDDRTRPCLISSSQYVPTVVAVPTRSGMAFMRALVGPLRAGRVPGTAGSSDTGREVGRPGDPVLAHQILRGGPPSRRAHRFSPPQVPQHRDVQPPGRESWIFPSRRCDSCSGRFPVVRAASGSPRGPYEQSAQVTGMRFRRACIGCRRYFN